MVDADPTERLVLAAAAQAGLDLEPESLAAVIVNARILQALHRVFAAVDLPDAVDSAALLRL